MKDLEIMDDLFDDYRQTWANEGPRVIRVGPMGDDEEYLIVRNNPSGSMSYWNGSKFARDSRKAQVFKSKADGEKAMRKAGLTEA